MRRRLQSQLCAKRKDRSRKTAQNHRRDGEKGAGRGDREGIYTRGGKGGFRTRGDRDVGQVRKTGQVRVFRQVRRGRCEALYVGFPRDRRQDVLQAFFRGGKESGRPARQRASAQTRSGSDGEDVSDRRRSAYRQGPSKGFCGKAALPDVFPRLRGVSARGAPLRRDQTVHADTVPVFSARQEVAARGARTLSVSARGGGRPPRGDREKTFYADTARRERGSVFQRIGVQRAFVFGDEIQRIRAQTERCEKQRRRSAGAFRREGCVLQGDARIYVAENSIPRAVPRRRELRLFAVGRAQRSRGYETVRESAVRAERKTRCVLRKTLYVLRKRYGFAGEDGTALRLRDGRGDRAEEEAQA